MVSCRVRESCQILPPLLNINEVDMKEEVDRRCERMLKGRQSKCFRDYNKICKKKITSKVCIKKINLYM